MKQSIGCLYLKQNGLFKDKFNMQCEVSSYSPLFSIRLAYNQAGGREGMGEGGGMGGRGEGWGGVGRGKGRNEREGMRGPSTGIFLQRHRATRNIQFRLVSKHGEFTSMNDNFFPG